MKAIAQDRYGSPEVLELVDLPDPVANDDQVRIQVRAASINPYDWHHMRGTPYPFRAQIGLRGPKPRIRGADFAGVVESVGRNVTGFAPGDEVAGGAGGSLAELVVVNPSRLAHKPTAVSFEQAASVPIAGETAIQGLRDAGGLIPGDRVLVNGASGGVGHFGVQFAKALGAGEVTGVCSGKNIEMVRSIGADHVIDYTKDDFTTMGAEYDVVLDMVGTQKWEDVRKVLSRDARVAVGGWVTMSDWLGPLGSRLSLRRADRRGSQTFKTFLAKDRAGDVATILDWIAEGKVSPVIDRVYTLADSAEAMRYLETMHAAGKVVITI